VPESESLPRWFADLLERELRPWLSLSANQVAQLFRHYDLLERWNRRMNLTSVEPGPATVTRHYCESLFFAAHLPAVRDTITLVDIGSGAGFPGIPISVLRPNWQVTLLESNQRKAVFLREATRDMANVSVSAMRAEEASGEFDWMVARALDAREVLASVPRLATRVGLLTGQRDFLDLGNAPGIGWLELVRLPWGDRRICAYGEYVPRGTPEKSL
jgi:16S rRNA (guanine(527)-N(7))-methyltransferase RsmG